MSDLDLSAVFGPQYEIVINRESVDVGENFDLTLEVSEPLRIAVGTGFNVNPVATGTLDVTITAMQPIGAYRAVGYDGLYTQPDVDSLSVYAGVTRMATIAGDPINVVRSGLLSESGWTWTPNAPIFIGANGMLTQTQPTAGNPVRRIGWAISATELNLDPYPIIGV
jgi:hypothetical protein